MDRLKRFEALDGLRGVCALLVVIHHCDFIPLNFSLMDHTALCVDFFFALSGFVIAHVYEERLKSGFTLPGFLKARARRLIPTQVFGTLIVAAAMLVATDEWRGTLFYAVLGVLLIPNLSMSGLLFPINAPLFSLWDEWIINALYAWIFCRRSIATLLSIAVVVWALLAAYGMWRDIDLGAGMMSADAAVGVLRAISGFLFGVVSYRVYRRVKLDWLSSVNPVLIYALVLLIISIPNFEPHWLLDPIVWLLIPFMILALAATRRSTPAAFLWLGSISYPLYIVHPAVMAIVFAITKGGPRPSFLWAVPIVGAALLLAYMVNQTLSAGVFQLAAKRVRQI